MEETQPVEDIDAGSRKGEIENRIGNAEFSKYCELTESGQECMDCTDNSWTPIAESNYKPVIYEFTEYVVNMDCTADVLISIPQRIEKPEEMVLISYPGKLDYKTHYDIDFTTQVITLKMTPKIGEIVEMFFYTP